MIDTDKYEEYQNARVEGFIPAEWEFEDYLLAEVKRLTALFEETNHHLDLMVERFGIEALVEMVGDD